jgi:tetratricopeptide (TPR) repeat protein
VDLGLAGLVALLWLLGTVALRLIAAYCHATGAAGRAISLSLGAGLLAHLLFGTLDAVTLGAKPGALLWAMLGLGVALGRATPAAADALRVAHRWLNGTMLAMLAVALLVPLSWSAPSLNAGHILASRALLAEPYPTQSFDLQRAAAYLETAVQADPYNSGAWYLLASTNAHLGDSARALEALRQGALLDSLDPLRRYALGETLGRDPRSADSAALQRVYAQWVTRYPRRAEWHAASAIVACEQQRNRQAATAALQRGRASGAEPTSLLASYEAQLRSSTYC